LVPITRYRSANLHTRIRGSTNLLRLVAEEEEGTGRDSPAVDYVDSAADSLADSIAEKSRRRRDDRQVIRCEARSNDDAFGTNV